MAENLNFDTLNTQELWCYDNLNQNCEKYGRLYSHKAAYKKDNYDGTLKNIYPDQWNIAGKEAWIALENYYYRITTKIRYKGDPNDQMFRVPQVGVFL